MTQLILAAASLAFTIPAIAHEVHTLHTMDAAGVPSLLSEGSTE